MKSKKRKDDTGLYMRQWNMELRETISRNMIAYENKIRECKELRKINKDLKILCSKLEREHETVFEEWKAIIEEYKELKQELQEANDSITWWQNRYKAIVKQKDDVVEYIKKYLHEHIIDDLPDEESKFEEEDGIPIPNAKEILLRMLGEIDE